MGVCTMFWARSVFRQWTRQTMVHQHPHSNLALTASVKSGSLRREHNDINQNKFCNKCPGAVFGVFLPSAKRRPKEEASVLFQTSTLVFFCTGDRNLLEYVLFFFSNQWDASEPYMLFLLFCIAYSSAGEIFEKEIILAHLLNTHMGKHWNMSEWKQLLYTLSQIRLAFYSVFTLLL